MVPDRGSEPDSDVGEERETESDPPTDEGVVGGLGRRDLLKYGGLATVAAGAAIGGNSLLGGDESDAPGEWSAVETGDGGTGEGGSDDGGTGDGGSGSGGIDLGIVETFAPTIQFGAREKWFPTDPREYVVQRDGEAVADGFAALDGYTKAFAEAGDPPTPVVFYRTLAEQNSSLGVIQYWMYSAFDQFSVNFHWHDWELLQVFFDRDTDEAVLLSASSHSRKVPNNEHLGAPEAAVGLLSEVGSHSSATDVDGSGTFRRLASEDAPADVTNALVRIAADRNPLPLAYGLPRGEGAILPYVVPELDGAPLYEHPDLPNVEKSDLIDEPLAIRSLSALSSPPTDVPPREPGDLFVPAENDAVEGDVAYELRPIDEMVDAVDAFEGPQLSFEFAIPGVVEDQFATHITSTGRPWDQPRYDDPVADVTDDDHVRHLVEEYGIGRPEASGDLVVARVQETTTETDGTLRGAPQDATTELEPEIGYTLTDLTVESVALLESDPVAVPTVVGALRLTDVPEGEHRLVVNGAGYAPYAERLSVGSDGEKTDATAIDGETTTDDALGTNETDDTSGTNETDDTSGTNETDGETTADGSTTAATLAGADGYLTTVPKADAVTVSAEGSDTEGGVDQVRIAEDYAGEVFRGRPATDGDGFAVNLHREGTYVVDVADGEGVPGAARVDPPGRDEDDGGPVAISAETGKASLAEFLATYLRESADLTREYRNEEATTDGDDTDDGDGETTTETTATTPGNGNGNDGGDGTTTSTTTTDEQATSGADGGAPGGAGVAEVFDSAADAAERAGRFAREDRFDEADRQIEAIRNRLDAVFTRIEAQRGQALSETLATVLRTRAEGSDRRAEAALAADR